MDDNLHELLDRTHVVQETVARFIVDHPALATRPDLKAKAEALVEVIGQLYQDVGRAS